MMLYFKNSIANFIKGMVLYCSFFTLLVSAQESNTFIATYIDFPNLDRDTTIYPQLVLKNGDTILYLHPPYQCVECEIEDTLEFAYCKSNLQIEKIIDKGFNIDDEYFEIEAPIKDFIFSNDCNPNYYSIYLKNYSCHPEIGKEGLKLIFSDLLYKIKISSKIKDAILLVEIPTLDTVMKIEPNIKNEILFNTVLYHTYNMKLQYTVNNIFVEITNLVFNKKRKIKVR